MSAHAPNRGGSMPHQIAPNQMTPKQMTPKQRWARRLGISALIITLLLCLGFLYALLSDAFASDSPLGALFGWAALLVIVVVGYAQPVAILLASIGIVLAVKPLHRTALVICSIALILSIANTIMTLPSLR